MELPCFNRVDDPRKPLTRWAPVQHSHSKLLEAMVHRHRTNNAWPNKVDQHFTKLKLRTNIRESLWKALIRFIEDPRYVHRKYMTLYEDKDLVNSELHTFLQEHGAHYFQPNTLRSLSRVYKDSIPITEYLPPSIITIVVSQLIVHRLATHKYYLNLRACILYLSQAHRRVRCNPDIPGPQHYQLTVHSDNRLIPLMKVKIQNTEHCH